MTTILTEQESTIESGQTESQTKNDRVSTESIWQTVGKQVEKIRKEIQDSRKSVDDAGKNTVSVDTVSSSARPTGFGR